MTSYERIRKIAIVVGAVVTLYFLFGIYDGTNIGIEDQHRLARVTRLKKAWSHGNVTRKKILFWNTMWGNETFYFGDGDLFKECSGIAKHCWVTHARTRAKVEDYDAILFHGCGLNENDVPSTRRVTQNYVFVNLESPLSYRVSYGRFAKDFFNATMTYRLDSDVTWSYGFIENIRDGSVVAPSTVTRWSTGTSGVLVTGASERTDGSINGTRKWNGKTKTAIWFVSNCKAGNGRDRYVKELAKSVDIDIFGKCGKRNVCPRGDNCFRDIVEPNYYFYLSFENSVCQDYVTEKLYDALRFDVVPIVYGGANYTLFAPPKSYINALDFDDPKQLAVYLKRLIAEPLEYAKYFEWKKTYMAKKWGVVPMCRLCRYLHEDKPPKSYSDISSWYMRDKCISPHKFESVPYMTKNNLKNVSLQ